MLKLLICIFATFALGVLLLELRQQRLELTKGRFEPLMGTCRH